MEVLLDRVEAHINQVKADPSIPLDEDLFSEVNRQSVLESIEDTSRLSLVSALASLLPTLRQDPTPAARLLAALLTGDGLPPFGRILDLEPETDIIAGLESPLEALNLLILSLLARVETPADVWLIAGKPQVVYALVDLWLTTKHTSIAQQSGIVLKDMLRIDSPVKGSGSLASFDDFSVTPAPSSGLIWRRIFKDKDVYGLVYSTCSLSVKSRRSELTDSQISTAQGRLLDLLSNVLYAPQIWESQLPTIEKQYGLSDKGGLLEFAMLRMVDCEDDLLMYITLIEFFTKLVLSRVGMDSGLPVISYQETDPDASVALDAMVKSGLHERTASYYLDPKADELFGDYLYGPAGQYIEAYAQSHTLHFHKQMAERVMRKITSSLGGISRGSWAHQRAPVHDLRMIATIPRQTVLSYDQGSAIRLLPINPPNLSSLSALARIFRGPTDDEWNSSRDEVFMKLEQASARALFFLYCDEHTNFWAEVIKIATSPASKDTAIAAVRLIKAVVSSSWAKLPSTSRAGLMSEESLRAKCSPTCLTHMGALVVMTEPALRQVLPFLLKGPENSSSDAYEVSKEKHEIIPILRAKLQQAAADADEAEPPQAWDDMLELLLHRQQLGPLANNGQSIRIPNPEVGTMEL